MRPTILTLVVIGVALLLGCLLLGHRADGGGKEPKRELDIVVTTTLESIKAHTDLCARNIEAEAADALASLTPLTRRNGAGKDGIARFRLLIEHKGKATVGEKLTSQTLFTKEVKKGNQVVSARHATTWYLPAKQQGTLTFKLLRWEEAAYQLVETWTIPVVERDLIRENRGLAPVASLVQDGRKAPINPKPECPVPPDKAKEQALLQLTPGPFGATFTSHWVRAKLGKVTRKGNEVTYEVVTDNRSPWPLAHVHVEALYQGLDLTGYVEFKPPIPPGKTGKSAGSCFVTDPETKKSTAPRFTNARFEAAR